MNTKPWRRWKPSLPNGAASTKPSADIFPAVGSSTSGTRASSRSGGDTAKLLHPPTLGTLSPRTAYAHALRRLTSHPNEAEGLDTWISHTPSTNPRCVWAIFYRHVLFHFPGVCMVFTPETGSHLSPRPSFNRSTFGRMGATTKRSSKPGAKDEPATHWSMPPNAAWWPPAGCTTAYAW